MRLNSLAKSRTAGVPQGLVSVCSAHPLVLRAALRFAAAKGHAVLIEATCNQVNHRGGYTGQTPADFAALVAAIAKEEGATEVILGGDHLGPNPWRHLPAPEAMAEAERMVAAYVAAGFTKIHLDCSMGCTGEPEALEDAQTAERAAQLARVAEAHGAPDYVIGTEVPPPGGADHLIGALAPTAPEAAAKTLRVHRDVFEKAGLSAALSRVVALVVQPAVEFGNQNVIRYRRAAAQPLVALLRGEPNLVYEAHSTDYQGVTPLTELVADGFAILKVGPELTYALREALYALDLIATDLLPSYPPRALMAAMEAEMQADPADWARHYAGGGAWLKHYSYSDRIRYYWPRAGAQAAVAALFAALKGARIPAPLLEQHLPAQAQFADAPLDPEALVIAHITARLATYQAAAEGAAQPEDKDDTR